MAVAALLLWLCTAAVGGYLLATSVQGGNTARSGDTGPAPDEPVQGPQRPVRARDRFDPPSLQRAKSEPAPGLRELAEFAHPAPAPARGATAARRFPLLPACSSCTRPARRSPCCSRS